MKPLTGQRGFTLVELMIVVIVVGVLAAVAIPMYQLAAERSKATEASAGLGAVRSAMRVYFAEHRTYANASFIDDAAVTVGGILILNSNDLEGRYFSTSCYTFDGAPDATTFTIECDGSASTAPVASEVSHMTVTIDEDGDIVKDW
jgi:prepilin-type N-terminal cleavage/methylation domain-containing protein